MYGALAELSMQIIVRFNKKELQKVPLTNKFANLKRVDKSKFYRNNN